MFEAHFLLGQLTYLLYILLQQHIHIITHLVHLVQLLTLLHLVIPHRLQFLGGVFVDFEHFQQNVLQVTNVVVDRNEVLVVLRYDSHEFLVG